MNDTLRAAHDKLQSAVEEIVSGDDWRRMLKVASQFHRYSSGVITYSNSLNSTESFMADLRAILLVKTSA
ncbi:MAG TPA: hypothetical protein VEV82_03615 [Actinomycetota bacterium]|nr:hypothetical protein [Actinomycetota bacterium]